jgi:hypothetical protein
MIVVDPPTRSITDDAIQEVGDGVESAAFFLRWYEPDQVPGSVVEPHSQRSLRSPEADLQLTESYTERPIAALVRNGRARREAER